MSNAEEKFEGFERLVNLLNDGRNDKSGCPYPILWVGAGASVDSGYPTTRQLIEELTQKTDRDQPDFDPTNELYAENSVERSFSKWTQNYVDLVGRRTLTNNLAIIFDERIGKANPTKVHECLVKLHWKAIITTNYDKMIDRALSQVDPDYKRIVLEEGAQGESKRKKILYKIHGDVDNLAKCVITESEYVEWEDSSIHLEPKLRVLRNDHPIVYVGCSMTDPRVVNWYRSCVNSGRADEMDLSIVIMKKSEWEAIPETIQEVYNDFRVHFVFFDNFQDLPNLLSDLVASQENYGGSELDETEEIDENVVPELISLVMKIWSGKAELIQHIKIELEKDVDDEGLAISVDTAFEQLKSGLENFLRSLQKNHIYPQASKPIYSKLAQLLPKVTIELVEETDRNANALSWFLTGQDISIAEFSPEERKTFQQILEVCIRIVFECCDKLPPFDEQTIVANVYQPVLMFEQTVNWLEEVRKSPSLVLMDGGSNSIKGNNSKEKRSNGT